MDTVLNTVRKIIPSVLADAVRPAYHYALAAVGAVTYRFPGKELTVIGITGTNGKSTVANLTTSVLQAGGHKVAMMTTINFRIGEKEWANTSKMTSPGRFAAQKFLRQAVDAGCTHAVIEVSSHALHWHRVWGIPFHTAVFTNLSRDHLDLHPNMEHYRNTKGKLFAKLNDSTDSVAVVNGDDAEADYFLKCFADRKYVFGLTDTAREILPLAHTVIGEDVRPTPTGSTFTADIEGESLRVMVNLPGRFNVSNALAAVAVGSAHGIKPEQIAAGLRAVKGLSGRMEQVKAGQPFDVVVDYGHTPDAFDKVLSTLRDTTSGQLIAVLGATGDRDQGKRPELGQIAAKYADHLVLTEEDPGSEDPAKIIDDMLPGVAQADQPATYEIVLDRRQALRTALERAKPDDVVVALGKGHETVMTYADGKHPWDDREVIKEEWKKSQKTTK